MKQVFFITLAFVLSMQACKKPEAFPPEPYLEFKSAYTYIIDTLGATKKKVRLIFWMRDGDGDMGFDSTLIVNGDTLNRNLFMKLYGQKNGVSIEVPSYHEYLIPFIKSEGYNKTIKADIQIEVAYDIPLPGHVNPLPYDTIFYDCYITDRALNKSNVVRTAPIVLPPSP